MMERNSWHLAGATVDWILLINCCLIRILITDLKCVPCRIMPEHIHALQPGSDRNLHSCSDNWPDDLDVRHRFATRQLVLRVFIVPVLPQFGQLDGSQIVPLLLGSPTHGPDAHVDPQTRHRQRRHRRLALERRTKRWIFSSQHFQLIFITTTRENRLVMLDSFGPVYRNTLNKTYKLIQFAVSLSFQPELPGCCLLASRGIDSLVTKRPISLKWRFQFCFDENIHSSCRGIAMNSCT